MRPTLRTVLNLSGTVLHTNLGRALLPEASIEAMCRVARHASNLEYDIVRGQRGERDVHIERQLCNLTGAEAAMVVNNNAAALLLVLNTLANRREVPTSRGELIEIGGSFRLPEIMARSGCHLCEVGTTNRTHLDDYAQALGPRTGVVLKAHTSNYSIEGFTASVHHQSLARVCHEHGVPLLVDLGSGALIDLPRYGLPHEATVAQVVADGADLVTFSGDKLLGGPQAGIIVGRAKLISRIRRNPLQRALRLDKLRLSALSALLRLYADQDRVVSRLPTLRLLLRSRDDIRSMAKRLCPVVQHTLKQNARVSVVDCESEIGSGSAPTGRIPSAGLAIRPGGQRIARAFRQLSTPVIGRLLKGAFILDLRCLDDEGGFVSLIKELRFSQPRDTSLRAEQG